MTPKHKDASRAVTGSLEKDASQDLLLAALTSVRCDPEGAVRAGTNVTCEITTGSLASEADLSVTQLGLAGPITVLSESPHAYRVRFQQRVIEKLLPETADSSRRLIRSIDGLESVSNQV